MSPHHIFYGNSDLAELATRANNLEIASDVCYLFYRSVSNDMPLSDQGQSSAPTYETIPGTYEEIPATATRKVKIDYEYTQNEAYVTTTVSESRRGN